MMLENGTPVTYLDHDETDIYVQVHGSAYRDGRHDEGGNYWYRRSSGIFLGDDNKATENFRLVNGVPVAPPLSSDVSLPDDDASRLDYPMFDGLLAYFPNALAEVARISKVGNDQHNPGQPLHWARGKSTDHENKIIRHLVDAGKLDGKGERHTARVAWRALALLQEELERDLNLPPSRASRDRPENF